MQLFLTLAGAFLLVAFAAVGQGELRAPCAIELQEAGTAMPGKFIPRCTDSGYYHAVQCHGSTGFCWCVLPDTGKEVEGSRVRGAQPQCTTCHIQRSLSLRPPGYVGHFVPQCDEDGHFHHTQLYGSVGISWCVDRISGQEIEGTRSQRGQQPPVDCSSIGSGRSLSNSAQTKGPCHKALDELTVVGVGAFKPTCTERGFFQTEQHHSSTGFRWCVNPETGAEIEGTKRGPSEQAAQCGACFKEIEAKLSRTPVLGAHLPQCDEKGNYFPVQSREGYRWCANPATGAVEGRIRGPGDDARLDCVNN